MDNENTPAPKLPARTVSAYSGRISLAIVTLTAALGTTLLMSGLAHAEPMISAAGSLTHGSSLQQSGFADERFLFGTLTFGFSLLAAGVWHRSFRAAARPNTAAGTKPNR
ncbi:hypothetical protein [Neorhizobium sp. JUb45]|uniref:hypothetical protein n=1 Tax=unclassified Neorhizobium TaxID=2629175 RepID=UPI00104CD3B4|nr:hypothetical protein [Neorhizobium sp. JUb45]TCR06886.1 hypothetical protein EDF70_101847 [Neorhizobium sp. JUb45]